MDLTPNTSKRFRDAGGAFALLIRRRSCPIRPRQRGLGVGISWPRKAPFTLFTYTRMAFLILQHRVSLLSSRPARGTGVCVALARSSHLLATNKHALCGCVTNQMFFREEEKQINFTWDFLWLCKVRHLWHLPRYPNTDGGVMYFFEDNVCGNCVDFWIFQVTACLKIDPNICANAQRYGLGNQIKCNSEI